MSHNMMTIKEFDRRYKKDIFKELSLEKWKRLDLRYLIKLTAMCSLMSCIDSSTCGYCKNLLFCSTCNLGMGLDRGCSNSNHIWMKFKNALISENLAEACDYQFQMIKLIEDDILKNQ